MFKTPHFWYKGKSLQAILLTPLSWLYQLIHIIIQSLPHKPYKASIPVICVGNAIAGGGGKTPTTIALIKLLRANKLYQNPYIITRGYGGHSKKAIIVNSNKDSADLVGDEPLLLAQHAPTIICADRAISAKLAEDCGADILIMDDGLLHQNLHKDLNFLVVDRQIDFGNNKTIPAGPLREPLSRLLPKIHAVITIGRAFDVADYPIFESSLMVNKKPEPNKKYIAFAGIAIPDKFKSTLQDLCYNLKEWYPFPDHHVYSPADIEKLKNTQGQLITTEKDYVRLPDDFKKQVETLPITIQFKNPNKVTEFIKKHLSA